MTFYTGYDKQKKNMLHAVFYTRYISFDIFGTLYQFNVYKMYGVTAKSVEKKKRLYFKIRL